MRTIVITIVCAVILGLLAISCSAAFERTHRTPHVAIFADDPALILLEVKASTNDAIGLLKNAKMLYIRGAMSESQSRCGEAEKILNRVYGKIYLLSGHQAVTEKQRVQALIFEAKRCGREK